MAAFNKFNCFVADVANGKHNLGADTLKILLTNVAPAAANAVKTDLTDIAAQNGYPAGGSQMPLTSSAQAAGLYKLILQDLLYTALAGGFGPFRYAALYNDTSATKPLIGWWDYGASITLLNAGDTFLVDADAANGVLQLQ